MFTTFENLQIMFYHSFSSNKNSKTDLNIFTNNAFRKLLLPKHYGYNKMFISVIISLCTTSLSFKKTHKFNSASIRDMTKLMQYLYQKQKESSNVERW